MTLFRHARLSEVLKIHALRLTAALRLTRRFGFGPWSRISLLETTRRALGGTQFVFEEDGKIAAVCTLDVEGNAFYLRSMSVRAALQGRGVGRRALRAIELLAAHKELIAIRLDTYHHAAGAGGFYEKCGYLKTDTGMIDGAVVDFYEKVLIA